MMAQKIDFNPFFKFYLDLDGVFADFDGAVLKITGKHICELSKKEMWRAVNSKLDFWLSLELMDGADLLWEYCKQYSPIFLTGLPTKQGGREQKQQWVAEKFGSEWETLVVPKKEKWFFSGPNKVLLDDSPTNIEQWSQKGGHSILHTGDVLITIERIEELRQAYKP